MASEGMFSAAYGSREIEQRRDVMDILTLVLIVVVIEAGLYGLCCLMCREKHVPGKPEEQSKDNSGSVCSSSSHALYAIKDVASPTDRQSNRQENNTRFIALPYRSLR